MHPLFATRSAFPAYLLTWMGLAVVPGAVLGRSPALGHEVLALAATVGLSLVGLPGYYVCRALPLGLRRLRRVLGVQSAVTLVWALFYVLLFEVGARALAVVPMWSDLPEVVARHHAELFGVGVVFSLLVLAVHYLLLSVEARGLALEREAQALLARQRAELGALRAQVHPHFLFNSLNTVSALIGYDPARAREACIELGTYLRETLSAGERPFVSLREEWALAEKYLGVEALRLGERLQLETQLDPAALDSPVPSLILQPLIENAITHGIALTSEPSPLVMRAQLRGQRLVVEVENPLGDALRVRRPGGVGLTNVRARLYAHYGATATLTATRGESTFLVRVELPIAVESTS